MLATGLAPTLLWVYIPFQGKRCFCVQGRVENKVFRPLYWLQQIKKRGH